MEIKKERLRKILEDILGWGCEHEEEFRECLVNAMNLTEEDKKELFPNGVNEYIYGEDCEERFKDDFGSEMAIRICKANNIPLSDIRIYGSNAYWINEAINNLQDLYDINENFVMPTGDEDLIRDYREQILEEEK